MLGDRFRQARQRGGAAGQHDVVHLVVRRAGEEELQRTADFLGHAVHKGPQHAGFIVVGQVAVALLGFSLFGRKTVLAHDQLRQLGAAEGLVPVIKNVVVLDDLHAGGEGADFEQRDHGVHALVGQGLDKPACGQARGVGFDVDDDGLEAGSFSQTLAVLDFLAAGSGYQYLDIAGRRGARADHAEIEADLFKRERDVLVGLRLDLDLQFGFRHAAGKDDFLGDDGRRGQRHGDTLGACAAFLHHTTDGLGNFVEFLDVTIGDPAALQGLDRTAFEHQVPGLVAAQLNQLDAG